MQRRVNLITLSNLVVQVRLGDMEDLIIEIIVSKEKSKMSYLK